MFPASGTRRHCYQMERSWSQGVTVFIHMIRTSEKPRSPLQTNTAELFDPTTGNWSITSSLNAGRSDHTASLLPNGEVLVAGGDAYTRKVPVELSRARSDTM